MLYKKSWAAMLDCEKALKGKCSVNFWACISTFKNCNAWTKQSGFGPDIVREVLGQLVKNNFVGKYVDQQNAYWQRYGL